MFIIFTEISEKLDAPGVTRFLNRLLTPLSDTILSHGGTIDKLWAMRSWRFGMLSSTSLKRARKSALAALRMQEDVKQLNEVLKTEAEAQGRAHTQVMIGIRLNTGPCCVGNLGNARRFDYSVVGNSVNVASRLERQCNIYGVGIIAGASVVEAAPDLAFLEIDLVKVKGRQEPIRIYTLLGGAEVKSSAVFQSLKWKAQHAQRGPYRGCAPSQ
jgi:adenylate cyclase